jgi:release factor glutamine methyltransferase
MRADELIERGRKRLLQSADRFSRRGDERIQAEELLEFAAGGRIPRTVDARTERRYLGLLERRASGEPVAYIRGFEEFLGMKLAVKPGAFIPRQSTEFLATQAIRLIARRKAPVVADLATGLGAVAMAVAKKRPDATVYGTDISASALAQARANAKRLGLSNVRFLKGSMYEPLPASARGEIDVITSHPPYIATHELEDLPSELIDHEPIDTLTDNSDDGLGLVRVLIDGDWLKPGGWMCIEVARDLARPVRSLLSRGGYREIKSTHGVHRDTRVLIGKR